MNAWRDLTAGGHAWGWYSEEHGHGWVLDFAGELCLVRWSETGRCVNQTEEWDLVPVDMSMRLSAVMTDAWSALMVGDGKDFTKAMLLERMTYAKDMLKTAIDDYEGSKKDG